MFFRKRKGSDFEAEIAAHLENEAAELVKEGMTPEQARHEARRRFGNVGQANERFYFSGRWNLGTELGQDLRYGLRGLWSAKGFAVAAAMTIALGVGANAAVFRLVDQVFLRMLPVEDPSALVFVEGKGSGDGFSGPGPYPFFALLRERSTSFTNMAVSAGDRLRFEIDGEAESTEGQVASGTYFETLGVKPALGRLFTRDDEKLSPPVAVISHEYWMKRFGGDHRVLSRRIHFRGRAFQIVGVVQASFRGTQPGSKVSVTLPISVEDANLHNSRAFWLHELVARLKPGVSRERAEAEVDALWQGFLPEAKLPADYAAARYQRMTVIGAAQGQGGMRNRFRMPLYAMSAIAGLVLVASVVNLANLLLARGLGRRREFAIRMATGAGRWRLVRQIVVETILLYTIGVVPGLLLADWGTRIVAATMAAGRRGVVVESGLDGRVFAFAIALTFLGGLAAALLPAWQVFRRDPAKAIAEGGARSGESRGTVALRQILVAGQVAVALVLLTGAITFSSSLWQLRRVDLGFGHPEALSMSVDVSSARFQRGGMDALWRNVLEAVRAMPGVKSAAISIYSPLSGRDRFELPVIAGFQADTLQATAAHVNSVSPGYFETLGIPLLKGRGIAQGDSESAAKVAVVNEAAAKHYFRDGEAMGKEIRFRRGETGMTPPFRVVGIVRNTKHISVKESAQWFVYLPMDQTEIAERRITLLVAGQSAGNEALLLEPIRRKIREVEPRSLVSEVFTVQSQIDETLLAERLLVGISFCFGALALALAGVGIFGVLSFRVAQERKAIGIRIALGAMPRALAMMVLRQSSAMVAIGVLLGLPLAVVATRSVWPLLFGLAETDVVPYVWGTAMIGFVGLCGALWPAWKAASVSAVETLRD